VISGSFPGALYLFRGATDGSFAKAEKIKNTSGEDLDVGRATVPYAVDWEGDGELDLVVGDIEGNVNLVLNESGDGTLQLGDAKELMSDASVIRVNGGDSGPIVTDWDGDGRHDLIVGAGDGSVLFYKNLSKRGAPLLKAPRALVGRSKAYPNGKDDATSPCGSRAKIAVGDWNADGKLDLLLGDFCMVKPKSSELSEEQTARRDELKQQQQELGKESSLLFLRLSEGVLRDMGLKVPERPANDDGTSMAMPAPPADRQAEFNKKLQKAMKTDTVYKAYQRRTLDLYKELGELEGRPSPHGNVWVFLRK